MDSNLIITIGRQLGSGGGKIAKLLAEEFNCKLYDRELLNLAARESGYSEEIFEQNDEHKNFLSAIGSTIFSSRSTLFPLRNADQEVSLFQLQSDAILNAAAKGNCVFVGRCADYILREQSNVVSVFITAPLEQRLERVMKRHECDQRKAQKILSSKESQRADYYNFYTGKRWGAAESYDLCIDSSILGIEQTARFIADFIRKR